MSVSDKRLAPRVAALHDPFRNPKTSDVYSEFSVGDSSRIPDPSAVLVSGFGAPGPPASTM
jgi:hypothetical protein